MNSKLQVAKEQLLLFFEQYLYILADPLVADDRPSITGAYLETKMDFHGDINGEFVMLFPENKSIEVVSNFLGLDSEDSKLGEMSSVDAASEIINILGANIISSWLEDKGEFHIGLPETKTFTNESETEFLKDKNITGMLIDGVPVYLKIIFR